MYLVVAKRNIDVEIVRWIYNMIIHSPIVPAVIPKSFSDLVVQVKKLTGLPEIHVDVTDGKFVPMVSWPYENKDSVVEAAELLESFSLEVDLMVSNPIEAAKQWLKAGADQLVFHVETLTVSELKNFTETYDVTIGIAASNSTPLEKVYEYIKYCDYIQVMGIAEIGSQGQPFDKSCLERIKNIRTEYKEMAISIDGSVNSKTLSMLSELSLDRYIVGSAIMATESPRNTYLDLTKLVSS